MTLEEMIAARTALQDELSRLGRELRPYFEGMLAARKELRQIAFAIPGKTKIVRSLKWCGSGEFIHERNDGLARREPRPPGFTVVGTRAVKIRDANDIAARASCFEYMLALWDDYHERLEERTRLAAKLQQINDAIEEAAKPPPPPPEQPGQGELFVQKSV